jgi:CNT family concentrative nucleoside transporter
MYNLISFIGIFILMAVAWALSTDRKNINWRVIVWGVGLQLLFALFIFVVPVGAKVFLFINDAVVKVLDSAQAGTKFVFGRLALAPGTKNEMGEESLGFILAFQALPTIVFFASLMGVLYYIGVMPRLIRIFSRAFAKLMRISGAESLSTAANIFVGVESSTVIRPYLATMTNSELCTILTAGMATVASNVLALMYSSSSSPDHRGPSGLSFDPRRACRHCDVQAPPARDRKTAHARARRPSAL